jgi:molecular chaperone GrpE
MSMKKRFHPDVPDEGAETEEAAEQNQEIDIDRLAEDFANLQAEIERVRADAEESRDRYLRTLADFDNYRKRQREDVARQIGCAKEELINQLLPIMDNFQRALESAEAGHSYETLVEGASLTLRQMMDTMQKAGVEPIEAVGEQFNPELHEALMRVETDEYPDNTIIDEFEKGYTINGKVLRPSRVRVAISSSPADHV